MRIVFWGNGVRGERCLQALRDAGGGIALVVCHPGRPSFRVAAEAMGYPVAAPANPNEPQFQQTLQALEADLFVLAGYGRILDDFTIRLARIMCLNLHAGQLPQVRGSSPLNWSLITGRDRFGLSVIRVDAGVDSGDVIVERSFPIGPDDTIVDLHRTANEQFPNMLMEAIDCVASDKVALRSQDAEEAAYYPLRFPDDGVIFWDQLTARQVHNRIRALTEPYPPAFTFYGRRELLLLRSRLTRRPFYGQPGRIYRKKDGHLLVCAADVCLWVEQARFRETDEPVHDAVKRYEKFATLTDHVMNNLRNGSVA